MKRRSSKPARPDPVEAVKTIYRELAERPIERDCIQRTECCRFRLTGRTPFLTKGEALVAAKAVRASGRKQLPEAIQGACPLLNHATGRCLIYDGRPFGCRTHFCAAAGGPYARGEVVDLIRRLEDIDRELGGDGAMALPIAVERALREV
ncbi:MAG TPA: YkgJ family cysteine cluster protein [Chthoniobacter sp.]|nr:YkgJ family cysteine cluster protein [Chthoniobacter sp.]